MMLRNRLRQLFRPSKSRIHSASRDSSRRAVRARDHLERKRAQERRRREREIARAEGQRRATPMRRILAPAGFCLALLIGMGLSKPLTQQLRAPDTRRLEVTVQGASTLTPKEILALAEIEVGDEIDSIDATEIARRIDAEPWIESVRVLRLPTGDLVIAVTERVAVARWQLDAEGTERLVDPAGHFFDGSVQIAGSLPLVRGRRSDIEIPTALDSETLNILGAIGAHAALVRNPASVTLEIPETSPPATGDILADRETGYVLRIHDSGPKALLGRRRFAQRIARFARLVESNTPGLLGAESIDLRYADRAVLRTEPVSG